MIGLRVTMRPGGFSVRSRFQDASLALGVIFVVFGLWSVFTPVGPLGAALSLGFGAYYITAAVARSARVDAKGICIVYNQFTSLSYSWQEIAGIAILAEDRTNLRVWLITRDNILYPVPPGVAWAPGSSRPVADTSELVRLIASFAPDNLSDKLLVHPEVRYPLDSD